MRSETRDEEGEGSEEPVNILIVDDRAENRVALRAVLSSPAYRLVEAASGGEALRHLLQEQFAVLLVDVLMPGMSGFELAALVRGRPYTATLPILFLTAGATDIEQIFTGYRAGAVDYLIKPLVPEMVRAKVAVFAELHRQRRRVEEQARLLLEGARREAELRLLELRLATERRFRRLADAIPHIIWTARPDGVVNYFNRRWFEYAGAPQPDASNLWYAVVHPDELAPCRRLWEEAVRTGQAIQIECRLRRASDGAYRWHLCRVLPEHSADGVEGWLGTFTDIEDEKRERTVLAEFKGTLEAIHDPLVIFHADTWRIMHVSHGASEILGYSSEELMAMKPSDLMPEFDERWLQPAHQAVRDGEPATWPRETRYRRQDGREIPVEISLQHIDINGGRVVSIGRDITERKRAERERSLLYQRALEAVRARDDFVSIASHELKTPLASLTLNLDSMAAQIQRGVPADQLSERMVKIAIRQVDRLNRLIDSLLDVTRMKGGRLDVEPVRVDLAELIRELVGRFAEEAARAQTTIEVRISGQVSGRWDPLRLEQVVVNLLSNAIKFGAGAPVEVTAEEHDGWVRLTVRDHGVGIGEEMLERIFERFERGVSARRFGGLGLGLYIVREIVEAHGGRVTARSQAGDGATFTVELPREGPAPRAAGGAEDAPVPALPVPQAIKV